MLVLSFLVVGVLYVIQWMWTLIFNPRAYSNYDYGNYNSINDDMVLATHPAARQVVPTQTINDTNNHTSQRPPTSSSHTQNGANGSNGAFFSPGSQMGSLPPYEDRAPPRNNLNNANDFRGPSTPASIRREGYEGSSAVYQSPPLIVPSRNGEGARRRSPYR